MSADFRTAHFKGWQHDGYVHVVRVDGDGQEDPLGDLTAAEVAELASMFEDGDAEPMEDGEPAGCDHRWTILAAQEATPPGFTFGKPIPHTAVLTRCSQCGQPESRLLIGAWDLKDLTGGER